MPSPDPPLLRNAPCAEVDGDKWKMKVVLIDHQDSFVYNLAQALGKLGAEVVTLRSDVSLDSVRREQADALVLSPGPGNPSERELMGVTPKILGSLSRTVPTLGVCLGHQAIGAFFGGRIRRAPYPCHGETTLVAHQGGSLYEGIPSPFQAARYHSLVVERASLPSDLLEESWESRDGVLMGLGHRKYPIQGVQFHPESYLTKHGSRLLANFLREARR